MKSIILLLFFTSVSFAGGPTLDQQHVQNQERGMTSENATQYPIILHHGLFGFRQLLFVEYFHQVPKTLREAGFDVYTTEAYAFGDIKHKSLELADQVDRILKMTGKEKVNIIAHSMGGLDARMIISRLGYEDKVASLSMIGTPNKGSYIADMVTGLFNSVTDNAEEIEEREEYLETFTKLLVTPDTNKAILEDALGAIGDLTQLYLHDEFNPKTPDSPKVYYQSWAGRTGLLVDKDKKDIVDPILNIFHRILREQSGENDGMVITDSAKWGNFRGMIEADHLDMVGLFNGDTSEFFDHEKFYLDMAKELKEMGF